MGERSMEQVRLNYYQMQIFENEIGNFQKENEFFSDELISGFSSNFLGRSREIVNNFGFIPSNILKNLKLYSISKSLYDYLVRVTDVNPLDVEVLKFYKPRIKYYDDKVKLEMEDV